MWATVQIVWACNRENDYQYEARNNSWNLCQFYVSVDYDDLYWHISFKFNGDDKSCDTFGIRKSEKKLMYYWHEKEWHANWFIAESKETAWHLVPGKIPPKCDIKNHQYFKMWALCSFQVAAKMRSFFFLNFHFVLWHPLFLLRSIVISLVLFEQFILLMGIVRKGNIYFFDLTHSSLRSMHWRCLMSHPNFGCFILIGIELAM